MQTALQALLLAALAGDTRCEVYLVTGDGCLQLPAKGSLLSKRLCALLFLRTLHAPVASPHAGNVMYRCGVKG